MHISTKESLVIDVRKIIASKSRKLSRFVPKFIVRYLEKIIHQNDINELLCKYGDSEGVEFVAKILESLNVRTEVRYLSEDRIKSDGRYIFVSNHPLGGLDGMVLISELGKKFGDIKFVVNDFLMNIAPLESIFVPVNKLGGMTRSYSDSINNLYLSQNQILYFPAGICSRRIKGEITDLRWQTSFYKKALTSGREIVPIYFSGRNSNFFYRLAKFRKLIGLKFNIEMLFLPDEMFRQRNSCFEVVVGVPEKPKKYRDRRELQKFCDEIRDKVFSLK